MTVGRLIRGLTKNSAKRLMDKAAIHKNKLLREERATKAARKKTRVTKPLVKSTPKVEASLKKMAVKGKKLRTRATNAAKRRAKK